MDFTITGLPVDDFSHLFGLSDDELASHGAKRYICDETPGFPDRIEMRDAEIGEQLILLNHTSMEKNSPYRATHAIFVLENAKQTYQAINEIPPVMYNRILSLRGFDLDGMMVDAKIAKGNDIRKAVLELLTNKRVVHIDAHNAAQGCFSGRITRV
ncbi:MAG: DUF1203 domain-containing protein [Lentilitoribacter sp.]